MMENLLFLMQFFKFDPNFSNLTYKSKYVNVVKKLREMGRKQIESRLNLLKEGLMQKWPSIKKLK